MKYHVMEKRGGGWGGLMDILFWTNYKKATSTCETHHLLYLSMYRGF